MANIKEDMLEFITSTFNDLKEEYTLADSPSKIVISREIRALYETLEGSDMSVLATKRMIYDISKLMRTVETDSRLDEEVADEYIELLRAIG